MSTQRSSRPPPPRPRLEPEPAGAALAYEPPKLERLGTVAEMTQGAAFAPKPDDGNFSF